MPSNNDECNRISDKSAIQEFYHGATVFITGGTGFMGKVLTEKLLRSCPDVAEIILLVRSKKDKSCYERLDNIFDDVLFSHISIKCRHKVSVVNGDCSLPGLGLSEFDRTTLAHKVDIVFHAAATVRFDEPLPQAVAINVQGTKAMLDLAKQMTKLKAFVHVSTAYSNCNLPEIEEKFYPPYYNGDKIIKLVDCLEKPYIDQLTPADGGAWAETPKVYNFVSSPERPIDWSAFIGLSFKHWKNTVHSLWYPCLTLHSSGLAHTVQLFLQLTLPCWLIDVAARLVGKQSNMMKLSQKIKKFTQLTSYFTTHQWKFHNDNVRRLWDSLSSADRQLFPFSFSDHKWDSFFENYMLGARRYVLKDDTSTIGTANAWLRKLFWIYIFVNSTMVFFSFRIIWFLVRRYISITVYKNHSKNL